MRRTLLVLVALSMVLAGCAEEPEPRFEPSQQTSSQSQPTEPDPEPKPWQVKSKAGAVAFVHHWVDVFNEAVTSGETDALREISAASCISCRRFVKRIDTILEDGGSFETRGWRLLDANANQVTEGRTSVAMNVLIRREKVRESAEGAVTVYPATKVIYRADLGWRVKSWFMEELVDFA